MLIFLYECTYVCIWKVWNELFLICMFVCIKNYLANIVFWRSVNIYTLYLLVFFCDYLIVRLCCIVLVAAVVVTAAAAAVCCCWRLVRGWVIKIYNFFIIYFSFFFVVCDYGCCFYLVSIDFNWNYYDKRVLCLGALKFGGFERGV